MAQRIADVGSQDRDIKNERKEHGKDMGEREESSRVLLSGRQRKKGIMIMDKGEKK